MKKKKLISAVMAFAMATSAMTAFNAFADEDETGNSKYDAIPISFDEAITKKELKRSDDDWYSFSLDTSCKLNVNIEFDIMVEYDGTYYEIVDADNGYNTVFKSERLKNGSDNRIFYLTAGNYYIHLCSDNLNFSCGYNMQINDSPTEDSFDSLSNNNIGKASAIEFDTEYKGQIYDNDNADYYTFDVAEEGMVTINFDGNLDNVDWKLYNNNEDVIQNGTFSKAESDDMISAMQSYVMTAGTFTLGITKNKDESCGNYTLKLDYLKDYNSRTASDAFACMDINKDHLIDANDASAILSYYAYLSTGGTESDMNIWYETIFVVNE